MEHQANIDLRNESLSKEQLKDFFLKQLTSGECYLEVCKAKTSYKMSRGSFKTRAHLYDKHTLHYYHQEGNRYLFRDSRVFGEIIVSDEGDILKLHLTTSPSASRHSKTSISTDAASNTQLWTCAEKPCRFG